VGNRLADEGCHGTSSSEKNVVRRTVQATLRKGHIRRGINKKPLSSVRMIEVPLQILPSTPLWRT
jgi:hypothetical protein